MNRLSRLLRALGAAFGVLCAAPGWALHRFLWSMTDGRSPLEAAQAEARSLRRGLKRLERDAERLQERNARQREENARAHRTILDLQRKCTLLESGVPNPFARVSRRAIAKATARPRVPPADVADPLAGVVHFTDDGDFGIGDWC